MNHGENPSPFAGGPYNLPAMPTMFRAKPVSIRWSLLRNILVLLLLVSLALLVTTYILERRQELRLSQQLIERTMQVMELELRRFFGPVNNVCQIADVWLRIGLFDARDPAQVNRHFMPLLKALPQMSGLGVGDEQGYCYLLMETADDWLSCEVHAAEGGSRARWRRWKDDGTGRDWEENTDFDPRRRPWYQGAVAAPGQVVWTQPYTFFELKEPGITAAIVSQRTNQPPVVLAFDVLLNAISHFTLGLKPTERGMVMVMTDGGRVIGMPRATPATLEPLTLVDKLPQPAVRDAIQRWRGKGQPRGSLTQFESGGELWWADVRPFPLGDRRFWVAVIIPQSDFIGDVRRLRREMMLVMAAALLLGVTMVVVLAEKYSRPLRALVRQTERIQTLDLGDEKPLTSRLSEVQRLADAHDRMRNALESFSRYVPVGVVRELLNQGEAARIGGRIEVLSVLFSDIHGFTGVAEGMEPDRLAQYLTEYFGAIQEVLDEHHATIDKFIGDAVLAFWGAPHADPQHALHAVQAALACRQKLAEFNRAAAERGQPPLRTSFGIATGPVVVGNVGSPSRLNYSVLGSTVNLASRLEGINRYYGTDILVSKPVVEATGDAFVWRKVDFIAVKGATSAMEIHEPLAVRGRVSEQSLAFKTAYETALATYHARRFQEAAAIFSRLKDEHPQKRCVDILLQRCRQMQASPPSQDADLTFRFQSK